MEGTRLNIDKYNSDILTLQKYYLDTKDAQLRYLNSLPKRFIENTLKNARRRISPHYKKHIAPIEIPKAAKKDTKPTKEEIKKSRKISKVTKEDIKTSFLAQNPTENTKRGTKQRKSSNLKKSIDQNEILKTTKKNIKSSALSDTNYNEEPCEITRRQTRLKHQTGKYSKIFSCFFPSALQARILEGNNHEINEWVHTEGLPTAMLKTTLTKLYRSANENNGNLKTDDTSYLDKPSNGVLKYIQRRFEKLSLENGSENAKVRSNKDSSVKRDKKNNPAKSQPIHVDTEDSPVLKNETKKKARRGIRRKRAEKKPISNDVIQ